MTESLHLLTENLPLLYIPVGAAVIGWALGRLIRGPHSNSQQSLLVTHAADFVVEQKSGIVRGRKVVLSDSDTREPVEEVYEMQFPSGMPENEREESLRRASAA